MEVNLDPAAVLAGSIILAILGGSALLWILHLQQSNNNFVNDENVPAWPIGWINFGIFLCAMISSVVLVQVFAGELIHTINANDHSTRNAPTVIVDNAESPAPAADSDSAAIDQQTQLTPWMAVLAVLLLQLPLLATFYGLRRLYPGSFAGRLSSQSLTIRQAFIQALPLFIRYLPVIWIASFVWSGFLTVLQGRGLIEEFPPQALVKLFTKGGDPIAMTLLVIFAVILAPIVEEIIFRGGIYRFLKSQTTLLPAQIISGSFFAIMHGNLMSFLPLVVVGVLLSSVYERSGSILVPMCFHACFNGFTLLMLFIMTHSSIPIN